jgi:hypothetical protein
MSLCCIWSAQAQTDLDYDMMGKNLFCSGFTYSHSSWDHYWEGNFKRDNANLGKVSTRMIGYMGNYGISNKLNVLFNIPYVKTKSSAGTMAGMKGFQDVSLFVKWKPLSFDFGHNQLSLYGVAGFSTPLSDYTADFLPLSIGLESQTMLARIIFDYERGKFFVTGSGTYTFRKNIQLDRDAYYTTELYLTNEVKMPNVAGFNFRTGYRGKSLIVEAIINNATTLGGFDITKNNMPFPSNQMNMTTAGAKIRFQPNRLPNLSLHAEGNYTIAGRNVGQAQTFMGGAFYIINFNRKNSSSPKSN